MADPGDNNSITDSTRAKDLKCKGCASTMGTISALGELELIDEPDLSLRQKCDTCRSFEGVRAAKLRADDDFRQVEHRRSVFKGRIIAYETKRLAHKDFVNFLIQAVEQVDQAQGIEQTHTQDQSGDEQVPNQMQTQVQDQVQTQALDQKSAQGKRARSPSASHDQLSAPKRRRRRRVEFSPSVIFRGGSEIRDNGYFCRTQDCYERGRNAAPDGVNYIDTSGSELKFQEFYQQVWKKSCRKWVDKAEIPETELSDVSDSPSDNELDSEDELDFVAARGMEEDWVRSSEARDKRSTTNEDRQEYTAMSAGEAKRMFVEEYEREEEATTASTETTVVRRGTVIAIKNTLKASDDSLDGMPSVKRPAEMVSKSENPNIQPVVETETKETKEATRLEPSHTPLEAGAQEGEQPEKGPTEEPAQSATKLQWIEQSEDSTAAEPTATETLATNQSEDNAAEEPANDATEIKAVEQSENAATEEPAETDPEGPNIPPEGLPSEVLPSEALPSEALPSEAPQAIPSETIPSPASTQTANQPEENSTAEAHTKEA